MYDVLIKNGRVVLPDRVLESGEIAVKDGKIAAVGCCGIQDSEAEQVIDAAGLTIMPGAVDCHTHFGIYEPLDIDSRSESQAALVGGVTTMLSYFRTGHHYMEKTGSYEDIFPEVLEKTTGNAYCDFGYHIAPMDSSQVKEMEWLAEHGVTTFKYFMFYKGLNLGANSTDTPTMSDCYDLGHLYNIMEEAARLNRKYGGDRISVSVHCEDDEIIKAFIKKVKEQGLEGLGAYSEARPPLSERMAILKAGTVANATGAVLNVLHITSIDAMQSTRDLLTIYPDLKIRRECTLHALGLTWKMMEGKGNGGKVNPPLRTKEDGEALWESVKKGEINWVGSDHANTPAKFKYPDDMWASYCGFGGTSLIYPFMISEGQKHGLSLPRIAELVSANPAKAHAVYPKKGAIAVGTDADFAFIDMNLEKAVTIEDCHSAQTYSPFEGYVLKGWPVKTMLRGKIVYENGQTVGEPEGEFLKRPC